MKDPVVAKTNVKSFQYTVPEDVLENFWFQCMAMNKQTCMEEISLNRSILENKIFQQPLPVKNFKTDILSIVKDSDKFHLYMNTTALKFEINKNNEVVSLQCGMENGETFEVEAENYIVSAGALMYHLKNNLNSSVKHFTKISPIQAHSTMPVWNIWQMKLPMAIKS